MGATDILNTSAKGNATSRLVAPTFLKSMSRIIFALIVVGGSYFGVSMGLRFLSEQWEAFRLAEINRALNGLEFPVSEKEVLGVKAMTRAQLEMGLYQCREGQINSNMKLAAVGDILEGAR